MNNYLFKLLATTLFLILIIFSINGVDYWYLRHVGYGDLLAYQTEKIKKSSTVDTLFVGDSALGNSLEVKFFDQAVGTNSLNLALTGLYGFAGSFNLVKEAARHHELKNVVVVQACDMMRRPVSYGGYFFTQPDILSIFNFPVKQQAALASVYWARATDLQNAYATVLRLKEGFAHKFTGQKYDYIKQGKTVVPKTSIWKPESGKPEKLFFLRELKVFCERNGIRLVYMHGPLYAKQVEENNLYFDHINSLIKETGIHLVESTPFPIALEQLGDSEDHVAFQSKQDFTKKYIVALKKTLAPSDRHGQIVPSR